MRHLQAEHREWLNKMYPKQPVWMPAAGMVEEAGELLHAYLKSNGQEKWGQEPRHIGVDWRAKFADAVGDCAIYCCSLCNTVDWDFAWLVDGAIPYSSHDLLDTIVELIRKTTFLVQDPCESNAFDCLSLLRTICILENLDFMRVVRTTWNEVKRRHR